ncbi:MAG: SGNH/GDSL hydrolase family protein, partial [Gammaproteobacteria bacterium]|nr:SGNH/GDSL hydrolase family protein [Gammaproteobacteria bacterium]
LQQLLAKLDEVRGQYDVAVLAVGVNDVTAGTKDAVWVAQLQALRARLTAEFKVRNILVSAVPPMQHFTALPRPLSDYLGRRARRLNALTTRLAKQTAELTFMPIELGVSPQMLAADGFHPSAIAYDLWAQQVVAQLKSCSDTSQISNK